MENLIFEEQWFDYLNIDQNANYTPQELGIILYAAAQYCFYDTKIDVVKFFGGGFGYLNNVMPLIYYLIDEKKGIAANV